MIGMLYQVLILFFLEDIGSRKIPNPAESTKITMKKLALSKIMKGYFK
jgi:hypothetical protein